MADYVWEKFSLAPNTKKIRALRESIADLWAEDLKTITQALADLRAAHVSGEFRPRGTGVAPSTAVRVRSTEDGRFEVSENGRLSCHARHAGL